MSSSTPSSPSVAAVPPAAVRPRNPAPRTRVLVVDTDRRAASGLAAWLCGLGCHASAVGSLEEAGKRTSSTTVDVALVAGEAAAAGAARVRAALGGRGDSPRLVAVLPANSTTAGWDAFVPGPGTDAEIVAALAAAREKPAERPAPAILGRSAAIARVLEVVRRVADADVTVLVTGESGTGKSLLARELHRSSTRRERRLVEVACGSLAETLLEGELFGHVAGAFTGATADREGRFAQADGGTIFLDEIATASPALQVKLLRVLQEREFEPLGGGATRRVDVRVVLATHENLPALVAEGKFRADLFWRINVVTIEMPPLRDRPDDIPLLAGHFLRRAAARAGRVVEGFTDAALDALRRHSWPGNVRELEHAVERGVFLGGDGLLDVADLPPTVRADAAGSGLGSLRACLALPERRMILDALERHGWRRDAAAKSLGINRTTLYKKARRLGIDIRAAEAAAR